MERCRIRAHLFPARRGRSSGNDPPGTSRYSEIQEGRSIVFEREYRRKDGSIFPASVRTWRLTDGRGKIIGIWSIVRDISQQKKLQKNLEKQAGALEKIVVDRTKKLKDSERLVAIGQTAGMVGHDIRNPLQAIVGDLYLTRLDLKNLPESELKQNIKERNLEMMLKHILKNRLKICLIPF